MNSALYSEIQALEREHWWYVARRKVIFDWVFRYARSLDDPRILDIGCGTGFNIEYLAEHGYKRVVGLELYSEALAFCRSRQLHTLVRGDATTPPFREQSFDMILALDLIEHVEKDVAAIAGLRRLLAPGGVLVAFVPAFQFLWSLQDEVSHHYRRYTARELRQKLCDAGLQIEKLTYVNSLLFPIVYAGRLSLKLRGASDAVSENQMHPAWANGLLERVFAAERPLLRTINMPFGVSLLAVARRTI